MEIKNKKMLMYCMNKAYDEMRLSIASEEKEDTEIYFRIGTCLHWIVDCYDRIKEDISEDDKKLCRAVKAANDCQKHMCELNKLHDDSNNKYPRRYPKHYGVKYNWESIEDIPLRHKNEKIAYKELFLGKNILATLWEVKQLLEQYYRGDE